MYEHDPLRSAVDLERAERLPNCGRLAHLCSRAIARRKNGETVEALDWRFVGLVP